MNFLQELRVQRWDDHRFYHQNRVNQTLHFFSALSFLTSYVLIFIDPVAAVMVGWMLAMVLRQSGHFFFESHDFDKVNNATHEYKEAVKVGYNLNRKIVLLSLWVAGPAILYFVPDFFGMMEARTGWMGLIESTAYLWLVLGLGAIAFRTVHLFFLKGVQSGLVWASKIITDPFHDVMIYYKAPWYLLKGDMLDDMSDWYTPAKPQKEYFGEA